MLHTRPALIAALCVLVLGGNALGADAPPSARPGGRPPNVVVFLADDQGWGDLSVHGNTQLRTPNIDSLARDGALFDRFYVSAVCSPTRAEFLTGRYHPRTGVRGVSTGQERMDIDERTLADAFRAAGYATGAFGKWHNGSQWPYHPNARGFDEYYGFTSGHWGEYFDAPLEHNGQIVRGKGYMADDLTDRAIAFVEQNKDKPFLCYLPFNTPHTPWAVPDAYWQRFKDKPITQRGSDGDREKVDETRCALAMCENLDDNVGRVLRKLDELKLADDTIVIYFSDNGPNSYRWTGGMKGRKASVDEGGVRSPLLVRYPKRIKPGTKVTQIAGAIDLLPTLSELANVPPAAGAKPMDGKDLTPLLTGAAGGGGGAGGSGAGGSGVAGDWPDRMIFSHQNNRISVRTQRHRLDAAGALFDMVADPGQTKDVSNEQPEVAAALTRAVAGWRADVLGKPAAPAPAAAAPVAAAGKGKGKAGGKAGGKGKAGGGAAVIPDDRPFPVGYAEFPWTPLPARDGVPHGGVKRSSAAPNCSYFVNWTDAQGRITWDVEVNTTGDYDVVVYYTCPVADAGSTVELSLGSAKLAGKVGPGWDPPLYTNQDTLPRPPAESQMKEFRPLNLGTIRLERGRGLLTLRAVEVPGKSVMDVRLVTLTLKAERAASNSR